MPVSLAPTRTVGVCDAGFRRPYILLGLCREVEFRVSTVRMLRDLHEILRHARRSASASPLSSAHTSPPEPAHGRRSDDEAIGARVPELDATPERGGIDGRCASRRNARRGGPQGSSVHRGRRPRRATAWNFGSGRRQSRAGRRAFHGLMVTHAGGAISASENPSTNAIRWSVSSVGATCLEWTISHTVATESPVATAS